MSATVLRSALGWRGSRVAHHAVAYRVDRAPRSCLRRISLGLALARRAAHAVDAGIEVSSEVGRGSEFKVVLPNLGIEAEKVLPTFCKPYLAPGHVVTVP